MRKSRHTISVILSVSILVLCFFPTVSIAHSGLDKFRVGCTYDLLKNLYALSYFAHLTDGTHTWLHDSATNIGPWFSLADPPGLTGIFGPVSDTRWYRNKVCSDMFGTPPCTVVGIVWVPAEPCESMP